MTTAAFPTQRRCLVGQQLADSVAEACRWRSFIDYGVNAEVSLTAKGWGTSVEHGSARYAERDDDYGSDHAYRLTAWSSFTEDGEREQDDEAGRLKPGDAILDLPGTIAAELDQITKVELQGEDGHAILRLDL